MDSDTPLDSDLFDAPKPKKRGTSAAKKAGVDIHVGAKKVIIAWPPHVGAKLALPDLIESIRTAYGKQVPVYSLNDMEEDEWQEHGGILTVDLSELRPDINRLTCNMFNQSDYRYYIHEAQDRRAVEIALLEISTTEPIEHYALNPNAITPNHDSKTEIDHAIAETYCWKEVLNAWHMAYPGHFYSVSNTWADKQYPWPVNIATATPVDNPHHMSVRQWKTQLDGSLGHELHIDAKWLSRYIHKMPQYAK